MDVLQLMDELQDLVERSSVFPWPGRRSVDCEQFYAITEQIRRLLPRELAQASAILGNRDQVLSDAARETQALLDRAHEEAQHHVEVARRQADEMVSQEAVTLAAQRRADEIIGASEAEAASIRASADGYAAQVLDRLDAIAARVQASVADGRETLAAESEAAAQSAPRAYPPAYGVTNSAPPLIGDD